MAFKLKMIEGCVFGIYDPKYSTNEKDESKKDAAEDRAITANSAFTEILTENLLWFSHFNLRQFIKLKGCQITVHFVAVGNSRL